MSNAQSKVATKAAEKKRAELPEIPADADVYELRVTTARRYLFNVIVPDDTDELWMHWHDRSRALERLQKLDVPQGEVPDAKLVEDQKQCGKDYEAAHTAFRDRLLSLVVRVPDGLKDGEDEGEFLRRLREDKFPVRVAQVLINDLPGLFLQDNKVELGDAVKNGSGRSSTST